MVISSFKTITSLDIHQHCSVASLSSLLYMKLHANHLKCILLNIYADEFLLEFRIGRLLMMTSYAIFH